MIDNLKPDDNPVIMIVKIRDLVDGWDKFLYDLIVLYS